MERPDKNTPNESINLPFNKQQRQQLLLRSVSRKIKFKIPKDELKDEDFDQIVVETSRLVTMNMQMQQLNNNNDNDTSQNDLDSAASGKASDSKETIRQSGECSPDFDWSNQTNEAVLMGGSGGGGGGARTRLASQPKRPMNAFMVWGQAIRRALHKKFSNVQNAVLSKALGRVWKRLELSEKEPYITRANIIKSNHKRDYPNYRYQPRRIQEKQRRMQQTNHHHHHINCHNLKQQRQAQQKTIHLPTSSVLRRSNRPVNVITSATQMLFEDNVTTTDQVSNLVPVQDYISTQATMKVEHHHDGDLWKTKALYTTSGEGDAAAAGSVLEYGGFLSKKVPHDQEAKYYRFGTHDPQLGPEYHLPSIEFDRGDRHNCVKQLDHTIEQNQQLLLDDNHHHHQQQQQHRDEQHQARLFYYNSAENLKQTDVHMMSQPVASNLCIDHLAPQQQQQHSDQSAISIDSYNSNYRQQFQQLQEEEEVNTEQHQRQLAQQLDLDDFSQYRQAGNGHLQYYDADGHYNQHNLDHHNHHHHHHHHTLQQQQQHLPFIRQMNEFAQTADHGIHRVYTQTENYHTHRSHSDEICPV